eukprot:gene14838-20891_t
MDSHVTFGTSATSGNAGHALGSDLPDVFNSNSFQGCLEELLGPSQPPPYSGNVPDHNTGQQPFPPLLGPNASQDQQLGAFSNQPDSFASMLSNIDIDIHSPLPLNFSALPPNDNQGQQLPALPSAGLHSGSTAAPVPQHYSLPIQQYSGSHPMPPHNAPGPNHRPSWQAYPVTSSASLPGASPSSSLNPAIRVHNSSPLPSVLQDKPQMHSYNTQLPPKGSYDPQPTAAPSSQHQSTNSYQDCTQSATPHSYNSVFTSTPVMPRPPPHHDPPVSFGGASHLQPKHSGHLPPHHQHQQQHQYQHQHQQHRMPSPSHLGSSAPPLYPHLLRQPLQPELIPCRKWFHYHLARLCTGASHILFYLVDAYDCAMLAVVGTDARLTGHFVYSTIPEFNEAPPLRCTNRTKVMEYLAALGATDPADPDSVRVPDITQTQLQMLTTADPMFARPNLDRPYNRWREELGSHPDGRHYKLYFLIDDSCSVERLVIRAEDSVRRDRRYTYMATPEFGSFKIENGSAVRDWLDFLTARADPCRPASTTSTRPASTTTRRRRRRSSGTKSEMAEGTFVSPL